MKLTLHSFKPDVPPEKVCQPGVDYAVSESDVRPGEALVFFDRLTYPRDGGAPPRSLSRASRGGAGGARRYTLLLILATKSSGAVFIPREPNI